MNHKNQRHQRSIFFTTDTTEKLQAASYESTTSLPRQQTTLQQNWIDKFRHPKTMPKAGADLPIHKT